MNTNESNFTIRVANDFSRYPAGRVYSDGPYSGEKFREEYLLPALNNYGHIVVELDNTRGYGSSFLEEAFGGLVRERNFVADDLLDRITLVSADESLVLEIKEYIKDAVPNK